MGDRPVSVDAPNTISGLQRKRAEIAGQIEHIQIGLRALVADLEAIDGALRVFDPDMRLPLMTLFGQERSPWATPPVKPRSANALPAT
jgi:hypothetical protein